MKSNIAIEEVKEYLAKFETTDTQKSDVGREKLNAILAAKEGREEEIEAVKAYMSASEVNEQKLLAYVLDFVDPTKPQSAETQNGEEIVLNAFLRGDELYDLKRFVERHKNDLSFGDAVYKLMDKRGMTAPQVYNGVFMRRQDFSRVTDPRCKNVTRRMVWQVIIGLHCTLEEADALLFSAGYVRRNDKLDLTMRYFIEHGNYDMEAIDHVLESLELKPFTY